MTFGRRYSRIPELRSPTRSLSRNLKIILDFCSLNRSLTFGRRYSRIPELRSPTRSLSEKLKNFLVFRSLNRTFAAEQWKCRNYEEIQFVSDTAVGCYVCSMFECRQSCSSRHAPQEAIRNTGTHREHHCRFKTVQVIGSKHNAREIPFARLHCQRLGIKHITIPLDFMTTYFKSSLLEGGEEIPEGHYADDNMKSTVVPFRNGIMLSIAVGIAESNGLKYVMMANHGGDHTIYPDCRPEFVDAFDKAAEAGTFVNVHLRSPYTNITKADIARRGKALGIDYSETWSCYKGGEHHCGKCGTCVERREAFAEAGIEDGTEYEG